MSAALDLVGDIHGHAGPLHTLLERLGYHRVRGHWRHGEGRRLVFLGDYIDRGPEIPRVLRTVRELVDDGLATALMGNHEFNAIAWATPDPDESGSWCRPHTASKTRQHAETLRQLPDEAERAAWIDWFRTLPVALESAHARAVHACWHPARLTRLRAALDEHGGFDDALVVAATRRGHPLHEAVETVLKGLEVPLPAGQRYHDKEGTERREARIQWWRRPADDESLGSWLMPPTPGIHGAIAAAMHADLPLLDEGEPPVFVGHYWLPAQTPAPLGPQLACLDYSVAKGGLLVAYRRDGPGPLAPAAFVAVMGSGA